MTVKQLREALEKMPDDLRVMSREECWLIDVSPPMVVAVAQERNAYVQAAPRQRQDFMAVLI